MEKSVYSGRSGRKLARIELIDAVKPIEIGERHSFRVIKGFGFMWRKSFEEETMTLKKAGVEFVLHIAAFPAEKTGIGILDVGDVFERPAEASAPTTATPSLFKRVQGYLTRPSERASRN